MPKKANPASTLLVVATAEPDNYFNQKQDLALYTDNEGNDYITNAGLAEHASPFTGEIVDDAGTPVTVELDPEQALAIPCETCETITLMDVEQASALDEHKITCVACGSSMEFEVEDDDAVEAADEDDDEDDDAEEASDDEDEDDSEEASDEKSCKADAEEASDDDDDEDDAEEAAADDEADDDVIEIVEAKKSKTKGARKQKPSKMKKSVSDDDDDDSDEDKACDTKDEKATAADDAEESAEDSDAEEAATDDESDEDDSEEATDDTEEAAADADDEADEEEAKVETELVDVALASVVEGEIVLIPLEGTKVGAFVGDVCVATINDGADNYDLIETAAYGKGLDKAVKNVGIVAALNEAGFDLVVIKASAALANAGKVSNEIIAHKVEEQAGAYADRLRHCMEVVSAGGIRGLFNKSGIGVLANVLEAKLTSLNVGNAKTVTKEILTEALPAYSNGVLETAHELLQKPDAVIESLEEQIASMDPTAFDYKSEVASTADNEETALEARMKRPARASETASVAKPSQKTDRPFMGLFK